MLRTNTCGELTAKNKGKKVTLCGWVHRRRNHGGLLFIDLRDRYGLTQVTFDPNKNKSAYEAADAWRSEWVVSVSGEVALRPKEMMNEKMPTGEIEIVATQAKTLSESKTPPFQIDEEKQSEANEQLRLQYRFIDLRRPKLQEMLRIRDEVIRHMRDYFHKENFIEVQTPILANSSPEGARDWLVPSRLYPGKFYALPQAPQQFKQLLMVAGLDRYFQIAPCFRDEDPRMDRHYGEFYQLDMEMSFVTQEDIFKIMEPLMIELTEKFSDKKVMFKPFPKISWREAMEKYGSDKPDLRFAMEMKPVTDLVKNCGFSVFDKAISAGGVVQALNVSGGAKFSRKDIDELTEVAKSKGAAGLAYIIVDKEPKSPILKFLQPDVVKALLKEIKAKAGGIVFFTAGEWRTACASLGAVRSECGSRLGLKDNKKAAWLWVTDFPMYDYSEVEEGRIDFGHNPFSMPQGGLEALETKNPLEILAYQYDFVLNGFEITSGAIRNHDPRIMYKAFEIAGYTKEQVDKKFGHMIRAFEYGAPPHGGNAPGIDRLLMVLNEWNSIRDIYAFPKDSSGRDVMLGAPSEVDDKQLKELHIKTE
ncbi:aspartate--tRNA ligase [Candidatus Falkowbacteria bacterium RIFOXYC2_FULL_47_12]|uniref:Aspartate--tRNA(Asp/Asn) ligase n=2 Tax=Candidatus Falkowiibacteriota TaxID=1752728 RepID=A0A1F5TLD3_9BACT|nr:MAG: aspartate--tRNA ligase [Candidatus Falkowbacteria bacterium RIFOXYA2_FULL_47_9]OGF39743.1 MAG: aspartate--tRNA ligase [Candidatus Falkowbacteria bacterium RIFOXYC2_FULL_47_12]